ncbi:translation initiation factor IF-2-like [Gallus gallus]|uniref:translation initiation factor IF-2-like n=1 Tax=Gallus gallus TaxID=9031 RepID=UPI001F022BD9|nr:translation initiation factor IF-2-like [Gallus gallus]XP_046795544.1 translation initiation factor IF-2-like [Gallus gallus]
MASPRAPGRAPGPRRSRAARHPAAAARSEQREPSPKSAAARGRLGRRRERAGCGRRERPVRRGRAAGSPPRGDGAVPRSASALPPFPGSERANPGSGGGCPGPRFPPGARRLRPRRGASGAQRCGRAVPEQRRANKAPPAESGPLTPRRIKIKMDCIRSLKDPRESHCR